MSLAPLVLPHVGFGAGLSSGVYQRGSSGRGGASGDGGIWFWGAVRAWIVLEWGLSPQGIQLILAPCPPPLAPQVPGPFQGQLPRAGSWRHAGKEAGCVPQVGWTLCQGWACGQVWELCQAGLWPGGCQGAGREESWQEERCSCPGAASASAAKCDRKMKCSAWSCSSLSCCALQHRPR